MQAYLNAFSLGRPSMPAAECTLTVPSVIVPVLSEQSTFMLPKFSMADSCFTMTFLAAMRFAPWARLILMIAGSNCGVRPTASASEKMNDSRTGR
jgi:hypothetical protein